MSNTSVTLNANEISEEELEERAQLFFGVINKWYKRFKGQVNKNTLQELQIQELLNAKYPFNSLEDQITIREEQSAKNKVTLHKLHIDSKVTLHSWEKNYKERVAVSDE